MSMFANIQRMQKRKIIFENSTDLSKGIKAVAELVKSVREVSCHLKQQKKRQLCNEIDKQFFANCIGHGFDINNGSS